MTAAVLWTAEDAARATGGKACGAWRATGVAIDSRALRPGDLFVALKGPRFDGHDFVTQALEKGAAAALVERLPGAASPDTPLLVVTDSQDALVRLAEAGRARAAARILAVTGSVGKTGTKEMLRHVLSEQGKTTASAGSHNNQIGVPLSLARMAADCRYGVFEIGMNHPGEITPLTRLTRPHLALITTVEATHLEAFASVEAIADAKAEIFEGMDAHGIAVLNRDNAHHKRLVRAARGRGIERIISFGRSEDADARLLEVSVEPGASAVRASIGGQPIDYRLGLAGAHWAFNSVAVLAAAQAVGADLSRAAESLATVTALKGRGRCQSVTLPDGAFELIDESYNASPASMRAAIELLAATPAAGRHIAVLGDMLELGPDSEAFHAGLAEPIEDAGLDAVYTAGRFMNALHDALPKRRRGGHGAGPGDLIPLLRHAVGPGDVVMVKGSAGSRMGLIVDALLTAAGDAKPRAAG
jgi:UDP-N-acetylmuramoyl-tripeptide--D-alanyl-D-alanine ligase